jgi:hypothetical protein
VERGNVLPVHLHRIEPHHQQIGERRGLNFVGKRSLQDGRLPQDPLLQQFPPQRPMTFDSVGEPRCPISRSWISAAGHLVSHPDRGKRHWKGRESKSGAVQEFDSVRAIGRTGVLRV